MVQSLVYVLIPVILAIGLCLAVSTSSGEELRPKQWPKGGPDVTAHTYVQENGLTKIGLLPQKPPDNMRNSEADFIELKDGRILLVYCHFTGGYDDHATAHIAGRYSSDGGLHWTDEDVVILSNEGDMNIMCPSLLRLQSGAIGLFYLRKNSNQDCRLYMRLSTDEAQTWSEPTLCIPRKGYFVVNNDRVIQLKNGRLVAPAACSGWATCFLSDDNGKTWFQSDTEIRDWTGVRGGLQEPAVIELKDGRLYMLCRTALGRQYGSWSEDAGITWTSPAEPTNIISPRLPCAIERIPKTGDILLVWVDHTHAPMSILGGYFGGKENPLHAAISRDEGLTWENVKVLEDDPEGWYVYPAIEFVGDRVLLAYCAGNHPYHMAKTQVTVFDVDWLYKGGEAESESMAKLYRGEKATSWEELRAYTGKQAAEAIVGEDRKKAYLLNYEQLGINYGENVDFQLRREQVILCPDTVDFLYSEFTPTAVSYQRGSRPVLEQVVNETTAGCTNDRERMLALMRFCRDLYKKQWPRDMEQYIYGGTEEQLIEKGEHLCECLGRLLVGLCEVAGIPGRIVMHDIGGHITAELHLDGHWAYVDPRAGLYFLKPDGSFASAWELWHNPILLQAQSDEVKVDLSDRWTWDERVSKCETMFFDAREVNGFENYSLANSSSYDYSQVTAKETADRGLWDINKQYREMIDRVFGLVATPGTD